MASALIASSIVDLVDDEEAATAIAVVTGPRGPSDQLPLPLCQFGETSFQIAVRD